MHDITQSRTRLLRQAAPRANFKLVKIYVRFILAPEVYAAKGAPAARGARKSTRENRPSILGEGLFMVTSRVVWQW